MEAEASRLGISLTFGVLACYLVRCRAVAGISFKLI